MLLNKNLWNKNRFSIIRYFQHYISILLCLCLYYIHLVCMYNMYIYIFFYQILYTTLLSNISHSCNICTWVRYEYTIKCDGCYIWTILCYVQCKIVKAFGQIESRRTHSIKFDKIKLVQFNLCILNRDAVYTIIIAIVET